MMFTVSINDVEVLNVSAEDHTEAIDKAARTLGLKHHYDLLDQAWVKSITSEKIYENK